jgi:energy-coupling factor transporter transmembrane protein EcfT
MRILFTVLGLIAAVISIILAILPLEKIAILPGIVALIFSLIALFMSKKEGKKLIQFTFILAIIAFLLIAYKMIFAADLEVKVDENFIEQNEKSEEKAIEELEDMEELNNFEDSDSIN